MKQFILTGGLLALLGLPALPASAQTGTARGKVLDADGKPIEGAKLELNYLGGITRKYETSTNKRGEYTQVGVQAGIYRITATKDGYQDAFIESRIALGDPTYLPEIRLVLIAAARKAAAEKGTADLRGGFQKALDLINAGKLDEAEAAFKEVLAKTPGIPEVHYNLGYVYSEKKDWAAAEAAYQKAIELRPGYGEAYVALARVYSDSGKRDQAVDIITKAAAANPEDGKLQYNLGVFFFNTGKTEEAMAALQKAETLDPSNVEVHYLMGSLLVGQNKIPEAIARLEKYLALKPANPTNVATAQGLLTALKPKK